MQDSLAIACPHCGAPTVFFLDPAEGTHQELVEDCQVCCGPILFHVEWRGRRARVRAEKVE